MWVTISNIEITGLFTVRDLAPLKAIKMNDYHTTFLSWLLVAFSILGIFFARASFVLMSVSSMFSPFQLRRYDQQLAILLIQTTQR